jgi:hypothetical protein
MENSKIRDKKPATKNSTGLDSRMLPRVNKALAIYQTIDIGEKDPLTGLEIVPPGS